MSKIQLGGFEILILVNPVDLAHENANKWKDLSNKVSFDDVIKIADISRKFLPDSKKFLADHTKKCRTRITLTNNEINDIMKVMKSVENRGILLNGTPRKISRQERGFLNFIRPLITAAYH